MSARPKRLNEFPAALHHTPECNEAIHSLWEGGPPLCFCTPAPPAFRFLDKITRLLNRGWRIPFRTRSTYFKNPAKQKEEVVHVRRANRNHQRQENRSTRS